MKPSELTCRRPSRYLAIVLGIAALSACQTFMGPLPPAPQPRVPPAEPQPPAPVPETQAPEPPPPVQPPPRKYRLSSASSALVTQAHAQVRSGDSVAASATLERALRIEPDNPLLWIELGRLRLNENNAVQADSMGRKALALATGDPAAQAGAWRLIAESLRAQGRNQEASEAQERADAAQASLSHNYDVTALSAV
jgi:predicted Zn-dependent protease